jgi:hypothetical protein
MDGGLQTCPASARRGRSRTLPARDADMSKHSPRQDRPGWDTHHSGWGIRSGVNDGRLKEQRGSASAGVKAAFGVQRSQNAAPLKTKALLRRTGLSSIFRISLPKIQSKKNRRWERYEGTWRRVAGCVYSGRAFAGVLFLELIQHRNVWERSQNGPQGLKPVCFCALCGTTESRALIQKRNLNNPTQAKPAWMGHPH